MRQFCSLIVLLISFASLLPAHVSASSPVGRGLPLGSHVRRADGYTHRYRVEGERGSRIVSINGRLGRVVSRDTRPGSQVVVRMLDTGRRISFRLRSRGQVQISENGGPSRFFDRGR